MKWLFGAKIILKLQSLVGCGDIFISPGSCLSPETAAHDTDCHPLKSRGFIGCAPKFMKWIIVRSRWDQETHQADVSDETRVIFQQPIWIIRTHTHWWLRVRVPFIAYCSFVKSDKSWDSIHVSVGYTFVIVEISLWSLAFFSAARRVTGHLRDGVIMEIHCGRKIRKQPQRDTSRAL